MGTGSAPRTEVPKISLQCLSHLYTGVEKGQRGGSVSTVFLHSAP